MTKLTMQDVTNLYLYKQRTLPTDRLDDSLISKTGKGENIDKKEFMAGPGRFVTADNFSVVKDFFTAKDSLINLSLQTRILANLKPGKYSKAQILEMLGYTKNGEKVDGMFTGEVQTLGFYDDGKGDLLERAYIWNTTGFKMSDNAFFVIEESGKRYIENFGIEPLGKQEDFDFVGGFWSNLVNRGLESIIDPSGIGGTVNLNFTGEVETYTLDETRFKAEAAKKSHWSLVNAAKVYGGLDQIIKKLWDSGSIKHLYQDKDTGKLKPIIYGTAGNDSKIEGTKITRRIAGKEVTLDIANQKIEKGVLEKLGLSVSGSDIIKLLFGALTPTLNRMLLSQLIQSFSDSLAKLDNPLAPYTKNGVVYVTGKGNDVLKGTEHEDLFLGGEGNDTYYARVGDTIEDADGKGKVYFVREKGVPKADPKRVEFSEYITKEEIKEVEKGLLTYAVLENYNWEEKTATFAHATMLNELFTDYTNYRYEVKGLKLPAVKKLKSPLVEFTADLLTVTPIDENGKALSEKSITVKNFKNGDLGIRLLDPNSYYYFLEGQDTGFYGPAFYIERKNGGGSKDNSSGAGNSKDWGGNGHGNHRNNASDLNKPDGNNGNNQNNGSNQDNHSDVNAPNNPGRNYDIYDPLALDLDGDGLETVSMNGRQGALFDHEGKGIRTATGWLAADDGFLVLDRNQDGIINDISELFSNKNQLSDGSISAHGFATLADLDTNQDQRIDQNDKLFSKLQIWRDLNQNGFSEANELFSLESLNIKSLHTAYEERNDFLAGNNILAQLGKYEKTDGTFAQMGDLNFSFNPFYSRFTEALNLTEQQRRTINLTGTGRVRDLREAAALSEELAALLQQYTKASDFQAQRELLPAILDKWAATDLQYQHYDKTLLKTVESTDSSASVVRVTPSQLSSIRNAKHDPTVMQNFEQSKAKIATLNSLYGLNIDQLYYTTDKDIRYITDKVNNMYQTTVELAYRSLLLQTRLKKYVYSVNAKQFEGKWVTDYSRTEALFNSTFKQSPENALYDLSEYLSFFNDPTEWKEGLLLLSRYIDYAKAQGFYENWATTSNLTIARLREAGVIFAESTDLKGDEKNNILLGSQKDNNLSGSAGDDLLIGGEGNDTLKGSYGADTYLFSKGHGQDVIYEYSDSANSKSDIDTLKFTDINYAEVKFRRVGDDLMLFGYHDTDSVTVKSFYNHEYYQFEKLEFADRSITRDELGKQGMALFGTDGDDDINDWGRNSVIDAGAGNDTINGSYGDDTLIGGTGNDILKGSYGADTYLFSKGHGQDVIYEYSDSANSKRDIDTLKFTDVNYAEVKFRRVGDDLMLFGYHDTDSVTVKSFYDHEYYQFEKLEFADRSISRDELIKAGLHLYGTDGNDEINDHADWDSILEGGKGNDILRGSYGADTYLFSKGHGQDVIYEYSDSANSKSDIDTLKFTDINYAEVKFRRVGDDLMLFGYHDTDSVTVKSFYNHEYYQFEKLEFADRSITRDELGKQGMALFGTDGDDDINDWGRNSVIDAGAGNDTINGGYGDDTLIGGTGNDILKGSYGADTYLFSKGHGQDVIYEYSDSANSKRDIDTLKFTDVNYAEVKFRRVGDDLMLFGYHDTDSVTVKSFYSHEYYQFEKLEFADRSISRDELIKAGLHLYGTDGNDEINDHADWDSILEGGKGNDILRGSYGADTYIFSKGHGQDVIYEYSDSANSKRDIDTLKFTDVNYAEVKFRRVGDDLMLFGYHDTDSVTVKSFYDHEYYQFEKLEFADRSITRDELGKQGMALFGTDGDDDINDWGRNSVIDAGAGNDTINGGYGDDTLIGGKGNDILKGSYGADTYLFSKGHGQDVIYEYSDSASSKSDIDTLKFTDIGLSELWFSRENNDLIIKSLLSEDKVTVQNWYSHQDHKIENIRLSNEQMLVSTQVEKMVESMAGFAQQHGGEISLVPREEVKQYINSLTAAL
ncbi:calcium-binding protein [Actinobacillus pleuropneumoniae]|uniref:calcium-binding protein n=1 Tax=Actinobacillus pleuropneumoniae TaxID=715 RepID=UPI003AAD3A65